MSTFYPPCPKCKAITMLARITSGSAGFHIRTFECPACKEVHQRVVALGDPMKSRIMAGSVANCERQHKVASVGGACVQRARGLYPSGVRVWRLRRPRMSWPPTAGVRGSPCFRTTAGLSASQLCARLGFAQFQGRTYRPIRRRWALTVPRVPWPQPRWCALALALSPSKSPRIANRCMMNPVSSAMGADAPVGLVGRPVSSRITPSGPAAEPQRGSTVIQRDGNAVVSDRVPT
jgi:hypothetical protein